MKLKVLFGLVLSCLTLTLVGCGSDSTPADPNAPATLTVTSSAATANITTPLTITANVKKADGTAVADGTVVTFATTRGTLSAVTTTTGGNATASLTSATAGAATVTATAGAATNTVAVTFVDPNAPATVTLAANPAQGVTNNNVPVTITATVTRVAGGNVPDGTVVTFATTLGTLSAVTTTTAGVATATLNSATAGTASVTATAGAVTSTPLSVVFIAQPTQAIVTVALTGTLPQGTLIGGTTAKIGFNAANGLGAPVSARVGIGSTADIFAANVGVNPTNTGAAWSAGTTTGSLQTLTFPITAGFFPTAADFTVDATSSVIDLNNVSLAGVISVSITSVVIQ